MNVLKKFLLAIFPGRGHWTIVKVYILYIGLTFFSISPGEKNKRNTAQKGRCLGINYGRIDIINKALIR